MSPETAIAPDEMTLRPTAAGPVEFSRSMAVCTGVALLVVVCSLSLLPMWLNIGRVWATDPLRLIGILFPMISLAGVLSAWRRIGWSLDGRWWGLGLVVAAMLLARLVGFQVYRPLLPEVAIHPGPVLFLFGCGVAVLFGGKRLLWAAIAPLCLLLFVNPVPNQFNTRFDLPLQELSANTARGFAHLIGLHPTGEQLRMMFTPSFGMQIVPGCNGVRGSVTFMYLALIFGYMRGLRGRKLGLVTASALLLGYAMNLLRLCTLVIYYRVGMSVESIQDYGTQVDYVIGCTIFLFGTLSIGYVIRELEPAGGVAAGEVPVASVWRGLHGTGLRAAVLGCVALVPIVHERHLLATALPLAPTEQSVAAALPRQVGAYRLAGITSEAGAGDWLTMVLADYVADGVNGGAGRKITLGMTVSKAEHTVVESKSADGIKPEWQGGFTARSGDGLAMGFGTSYYREGGVSTYDSETNCTEVRCVNPLPGLSGTEAPRGFLTPVSKQLPIVLREQWATGDGGTFEQHRQQAEADVRGFAGELRVARLVPVAGSQP